MLTRQPHRFFLADDPGAGKTILAGLLIKELLVRGDLRRCLIVYDTERQLLYVAYTRVRDTLLVTGVEPATEFSQDIAT